MISPADGVAIAIAVIWALLLVRAFRAFSTPARAATSPSNRPAEVAAFVPARDEADVIEACLAALASQPELTVISVTDDGSTDGTGDRIAAAATRDPRIRARVGRGPGPGECGKPAALRDAVVEVGPADPWLLFVDADVRIADGAVGALLGVAEAHGADLVSGFPQVELRTLIEHLVMPSVGALIVAHHAPDTIARDASRAFANGQVILVRRSVYEAAGGHEGVVGEILEDVRLAERVKAAGGRLAIVDLRHLARTRMYEGWAEMREGWSKNLFLLLGASVPTALSWALGTLVLGCSGLVALALSPGPVGLAVYLWVTAAQGTMRKIGGQPALWAVTAPIGAVLSAYLICRSTWLFVGRRAIAWKGRKYG